MAGEGQEVSSLYVRLGLNSDGVREGVTKLNREMKIVQEEFKLSSTKMGEFATAEEKLRLNADSTSKQLEIQKEKVKLLTNAFKEAQEKAESNKVEGKIVDVKALQDLHIRLMQAQRKEEELKNTLKGTNKELSEQGKEAKNLGENFNEASGKISKFGNFLKNSLSTALGISIFETIKTGFKKVGEASIGFNADLEQNQIAFETMLGSGEKAKKFLDGLQQFAADTPFEFPELTTASKKLLAFGFEANKIPGMLRSIGDASAGLGMSGADGLNRIGLALGQIRAKGKLSSQEMMQLTETGIPAWEMLANSMGKSTAEVMKMTEKGMIPAQQAIDVLIAGMEEKFPNMMDKQSKSFKGMMSSIKDNLQIALGQTSEKVFIALKGHLESVNNGLQQFTNLLKSQGLQAALKSIMPDFVVNSMVKFRDILAWLIQHGSAVKATIVSIGAAILTIKLASLILDMKKTIVTAGGVMKALSALVVVNPVILAIGAAVGLLAGLAYELYKNWKDVPPYFSSMWGTVKNTFSTAGNAIMVCLRGLQVGLAEFLSFTLVDTTKMVSGMLGLFSHIPKIGDAFKLAQSGVDGFSNSLQGFVTSSHNALNNAVADTKSSADSFTHNFADTVIAGNKLNENINKDILGLVNKTKDNFKSLGETPKVAIEGFDTSVGDYKEAGENLLGAIGEGTEKGADKLRKEIKTKFDNLIILIDSEIKRLLQDTDNLEQYAQNLNKAMELQKQKIELLTEEYNKLIAVEGEQSEAVNSVLKELEDAKNAYIEYGNKVSETAKKIEEANVKAINDLNSHIKESLKEKYQQEKEQREKALEDELESLNSSKEKVVKYIEETYEFKKENFEKESKDYEEYLNNELKGLDKWKDAQLKAIEDVYDKRVKAIEESSNKQIKALENEIEALNNVDKSKDRAEKNKQELNKISSLKGKIEFEHNDFNKLQLQKELDKALKEREERLSKEALDDKKDSIKKQIEDIKDSTSSQKKILEEQKKNEIESIKQTYEARKDSLQKQLSDYKKFVENKKKEFEKDKKNELSVVDSIYKACKKDLENKKKDLKDFYAEKLKDANLQAETEKLIMQNNQKEIVELLKSFGKEYEQAGQTLGERLVAGFRPKIDKIKSMISSITSDITKARDEAISLASEVQGTINQSNSSSSITNNSRSKTNNYNFNINNPKTHSLMDDVRQATNIGKRLSFGID